MAGYQLTSNEVLAWIATSPDPKEVGAVLVELPKIAANPYAEDAMPVPGRQLAKFTWPVPDTYLAITYLVVEQFRTVRIIRIATPDQ